MQQHLGRLDGVAKVEVNLLDGRITIYPKSDGTLDPALILKATYDSGVSPVEMTIVARGRLLLDAQKGLVFEVAANQGFAVNPNELSRKLEELVGPGAEVRLRGRLYQKPPGKQKTKSAGPLRLEILELLKKE